MSEAKRKKTGIAKNADITASLISAASQGNLDSMKKLIKSHGLSECEYGDGGYVPLFVAIQAGQVEFAKFLLEHGAKASCKIVRISTPLHVASEKGYTELVRLIVARNVPVDIRNDRSETPLHLAAKGGYAEIVEVLLKNNASLILKNKEGLTPLFLAIEGRHEEVVQMLFKHACANLRTSARTRNSTLLNRILLCKSSIRDKVNKLVVQIVVNDVGQSKIVDDLIGNGFVLSHEYVNKALLFAAVKNNYIKLIDSILRSGANSKNAKHNPLLLHTAVKNGCKKIVELLLSWGIDADAKNEKGKTSLCYSLNSCQEDKCSEIVQLLLANGAVIKKAPKLLHEAIDKGLFNVCKFLIENHTDINALNSKNETPLYVAVSKACNYAYWNLVNGKPIEERTRNDIVKLLLNSSNDVNIDEQTYKAFHLAVSSGHKEVVLMFLEFGVDIDVRNKKKNSPLYLASLNGHTDIIEILCKKNAEVNPCNRSPLQIARCSSKVAAVEMLLKFGADTDFYFINKCDYNDSSDDNDDSDDSTINNCNKDCSCVVATLKKHIMKMKAAGLAVTERNPYPDYTPFPDFQKDCKAELDRMKITKVNAQFSLYDILVNGKHPSYAKNKSLIGILNKFNFSAFPIYKNLITGNLEISKSRLELLQSGQRALDILVKISSKLNGNKYSVLPVEILEEIVSYLSFDEVKRLVFSGKALKRQLGLNFPLYNYSCSLFHGLSLLFVSIKNRK